MEITKARHSWREPDDFSLFRPRGHQDWSFVHFISEAIVDIDGEQVRTSPHACIFYRPGTLQHFFASGKPLLHDWIHFRDISESQISSLGLPIDQLFYPEKHDFITDGVFEIELEFFAKRLSFERMMSLKTEELFLRLSRTMQYETREPIDITTALRLKELRRNVFANLKYHWTVAEMAKQICCSPSRLFALYTAYYETSPIDDLIRTRIDVAKEALRFSNKPITDIAFSLGYENPTHFSRQFRKFTGLSPSQYRKQKHNM